jgi:hypothetical protein
MEQSSKTIALPSGAVALIRQGKGRDLMRAQRVVPTNAEPIAVTFALMAELVEVDGKKLVYEDVLEMDLGDVLRLLPEVVGEGDVPQRPDLPASSGSDSTSAI